MALPKRPGGAGPSHVLEPIYLAPSRSKMCYYEIVEDKKCKYQIALLEKS